MSEAPSKKPAVSAHSSDSHAAAGAGSVVVVKMSTKASIPSASAPAAERSPTALTPKKTGQSEPQAQQSSGSSALAGHGIFGRHGLRTGGVPGLAIKLIIGATAVRCGRWHWLRLRTRHALSTASPDLLLYLLRTHDERGLRAVVTAIANDAVSASNARLSAPETISFPEGGRTSSCHTKSASRALSFALSSSTASLAIRSQSIGLLANGSTSSELPSPALSEQNEDGPFLGKSPADLMLADPAASPQSVGGWPYGVPEEGAAVSMLREHGPCFDALQCALRRLLRSRAAAAQRDAASAVQALSFACDGLAAAFTDGGAVPLLVNCLRSSAGVRLRGNARLRQPVPRPAHAMVPNPLNFLPYSPYGFPAIHRNHKAGTSTFTLSPRNSYLAWTALLTTAGRVWSTSGLRNLHLISARGNGKRQAVLEALQNLTASRDGAKALLKDDASLALLSEVMYTGSDLARLAAVETLHSLVTHFPSCRGRIYAHAGDVAVQWVSWASGSSPVAREACMRTLIKLRPERAALPSDYDECTMYS